MGVWTKMLITKRYATIPMTAAARQAVRTLYPPELFLQDIQG